MVTSHISVTELMPQGKQVKKQQKLQLVITVTSAKQQKQLKVKKI